MKRSLLITIVFSISAMSILFAQGVTTATLSGRVIDASGSGIPGANVVAVHQPSGSQYGNVSDPSGYFRLPNMRVGGPYTVTISFIGYENFQQEGIYLTLGQSLQLNPSLVESSTQLNEVVVTSSGIFDGNRTGQETIVDERTINDLPTISRSIGDYARFNPLANIQQNADGFTISIAGQNNRYNAIYIDGAVNNDVFGLAGSGTNGGQTGVQPISIDAIEQFQISVAPFDVRQSGFAGGSINAVTRSGTNDVQGSAYYFWRNQNLAGKTPTDDPTIEKKKLNEFSAQTYGFRLGGPIVKDKVFFFLNGEQQKDKTPQPFVASTYTGNATLAQINQVADLLKTKYGYDPGTFTDNEAFLNSDKILVKVDWNLSPNHKLSVRHSYLKAENLEARRSSPTFIGFQNGSEYFISTTNSSAIELNSTIGNSMSNKFTFGSTIVRDDRDPFGNPFPTIRIDDVGGGLELGAERFSTANLLNQDIITVNNDLELYKGKHTLLFGANFEYYNVGNLFIRENYGSYRFFNTNNGPTGVERFLNNLDASGNPISSRIERSWSQVDNVTGDDSKAIAAFKQIMLGFYVQDQIQVNDKLKLTGGIRVDLPVFLDDQPVNAQFNSTTIPLIEAQGYNLKGAKTGSFIKTQALLSPRVGFNYDINGDKTTQLRGGVGLFTSRIPLVWPGGAYNNYGFNIGGGFNNNESFNPDVNAQWPGAINLNSPNPSGQIDLFAEDFKIPRVLKVNLAIDKKLPLGLIGTLEGLYTKNINNVLYQNLNLLPSAKNLTGGPDNRPLYTNGRIDPTYTGVYLASNTNKGYAYNLVASLSRPFTNGVTANIAYSYGDSFSVFDGTSSQNNSQWAGYFNVKGRNIEGDAERSQFSQGGRILGQVSYRKEYLNSMASQLSLIFNGQAGQPFSYVVGASNSAFVNDGGFSSNELVFVPANQSQINLVDVTISGNTYTAAQQWQALDSYISEEKSLDDRRGQYAQRNGGRTPFEAILDLRFLQDFYVKTPGGKRNTIQLSVDVFNLTNLINPDWGKRRVLGFNTYSLVNLSGFESDGTTPRYTVAKNLLEGKDPWDNSLIDSGFRSARWQMQLGVRYIFGN